MGVTDVIVTIFDDVFEVCFLTEKQLLFFMADIIASVAEVIANTICLTCGMRFSIRAEN